MTPPIPPTPTTEVRGTTPMHVFPAWAESRSAWDLLNLTPDALTLTPGDSGDLGSDDDARLAEAFAATLRAGREAPGVVRQAWKALHDPWYRSMVARGASWPDLAAAGLFDDGLDPWDWRAWWQRETQGPLVWSTPWGHLPAPHERLPDEACLLLLTGSFAPLHAGHAAVMTTAVDACRARGWAPVGGFLSPSHEAYVSTKDDGRAAMGAWARVAAAQRWLAEQQRSDPRVALWAVDPWEALHAPGPLNFTDVLRRLRAYLDRVTPHLAKAPIVVVFGSDNAGFLQAFERDGRALVVERSTSDRQRAQGAYWDLTQRHPESHPEDPSESAARLIWAVPEVSTAQHASTMERRCRIDFAVEPWPRAAPQTGRGVVTTSTLAQPVDPMSPRSTAGGDPTHGIISDYVLRDDGPTLWGDAPPSFPGRDVSARWAAWMTSLQDALTEALALWPSDVRPRFVVDDTVRQARWVQRLARDRRWLSLDAVLSERTGLPRLDGARVFHVADGQTHAHAWMERPGRPPWAVQLHGLRAGTYDVVDDDISTGKTLRSVAARLAPSVTVGRVWTLTGLSGHRRHGGRPWALFDVVDARDWLLGAPHGGLVVRLPDQTLGRVPYWPPLVSLTARASLPAATIPRFTQRILQANLEFWRDASQCLADLDPWSAAPWLAMGWPEKTELAKLIVWLIDRMGLGQRSK